MTKKQKERIGSSFDDFLKEEGIYEGVTARAIKRVIARQLDALMDDQKLTKSALAKRMKTSRTQLDRLLDPENESVTLGTLTRAARRPWAAICEWSWCDAPTRRHELRLCVPKIRFGIDAGSGQRTLLARKCSLLRARKFLFCRVGGIVRDDVSDCTPSCRAHSVPADRATASRCAAHRISRS